MFITCLLRRFLGLGALLGVWAFAGCLGHSVCPPPAADRLPKELDKTTMPPYVIETPDVLAIDALRLVPLPPYRIEPPHVLAIAVPPAPPTEPITGLYAIAPDGRVNLGFSYGSVRVTGLTLPEAKRAIENHLKAIVQKPQVTVSLAQSRGLQQIRGDHLVRPDGTI